ncbi:MAG: hypothetical protein RL095_259 [Verrucomicrobiota bacterium]|jgi:hypothetical protein
MSTILNEIRYATLALPQKNFGLSGANEPEKEFADAFSSVYMNSYACIHKPRVDEEQIFLREFPVPSLGIADLVSISMIDSEPRLIRAFEFKIDAWSKGLSQAFRYNYYADAAILVVPTKKLDAAQKSLDLFESAQVGLWGFDMKTLKIARVFTPRPKKAYMNKYRQIALRNLEVVIG